MERGVEVVLRTLWVMVILGTTRKFDPLDIFDLIVRNRLMQQYIGETKPEQNFFIFHPDLIQFRCAEG